MPLPPAAEDSTILVTGASSGIGAELARQLSHRGYHVTLVARRAALLESLAQELGGADPAVCDLSDASARAELIARLQGSSRSIVGVCNNAGYGSSGEFASLALDRELAEIRLNVEALVELTGALLPAMITRGAGAVLNVASIAGFQPLPGMATYSATKAFVISFSEALASELRGTGVSCTVLCPGPTRTAFSQIAGVGDIERAAYSIFATPRQVAAAGVEAMLAGHRMVIPRHRDRAAALAGRFSPRSVQLAMVRVATLGKLRRRARAGAPRAAGR